jgi:predicted Zn-dependent protease
MNGFVRKTLIFAAVMVIVAGAGWGGRKLYKKATENRLLAEASQYMGTKDFRNAGLCLQRCLEINPFSARASKLTADMLEETGSPAALNWRIRAFQLQTNNIEYRFAWAETALKMRDLNGAAQALSGLDEKSRSTATFHKLAGGLAWQLKDAAVAEDQYAQAQRLEPNNQATILNLSTIRLASTNSAEADAARLALEQIPTNSAVRPIALRYLAADAAAQGHYDRALSYSDAVISAPWVTYNDKIAHLQLLLDAKSPAYKDWLAGLEDGANHSPEQAYALGHWMATSESPSNALHWLRSLPTSQQTNLPVPLIIADCQIAVEDWTGLRTVVEKHNWGDAEYYRLCLESMADRHLGESLLARSAWERALRLASRRLDRLTRLTQITGSWGWRPEMNQVLQEVISDFPKEKWAVDELMASYYADGNTAALAGLLARAYSANPSDNRLKNNLASVSLLRNSDLENAYRLAREAYDSSPDNPFFISTYAYSLLLQKRPDDALKILGGLKAEYLKNPSIAAYYGVVQAQTGHKDVAREPLKLAEASRLLPEEKEIVRQAATRL